MRVLVVTSSPPLVEGGHLVISRELVQACREAGHLADLVITPQNRFGRQAAAYLATWLTDLGVAADGQPIDHIVSLRYPSFAIRHPSHTCWLNHTMREYYDQWEPFSRSLSWPNRMKEGLRRRLIHTADRYLLTVNVGKVFAQSQTVQARLQRWGGIPSKVLYPPPPVREYRSEGYGDYIFAVSRLAPLKRFDLLLRALAEPVAAGIKCVIAGEGTEMASLVKLRARLALQDRVQFVGRLSDAEMIGHLARCRAVAFVPCSEDYGFVTVEAFACGRPVITVADSGGPAELVQDGINGYVTAPTSEALAVALRDVMSDRARAIRMGEAGLQTAASMTWAGAVEELLK